MNHITVLEESIRNKHQENWHIFLTLQKMLVESHFDWLSLNLNSKNKTLYGSGLLNINGKNYTIILMYSPFNKYRYDRIFIKDPPIKYHRDIHLYSDHSLCLYHPKVDQALIQKIPLVKMIPWISEWIVFYLQWKKYAVWLGKEIKH
ncbi:MAG: hypothetical protein R8N23_20040 [Reichenbachiella sp.]|uniref:hypothetical protein n=1 Tax=Reichenbachiella sp. TaxID=2184521 RepID=UPI00296604BC|nr:hypothetical protein [Reichenbachiella sp.]MDW3212171.1 hypothetical protein [Reichenbachiella sp.]